MSRKIRRLHVALVLEIAALAGITLLGDPGDRLVPFLVLFFAAAGLYLAALAGTEPRARTVWVGAVLLRLAMLPAVPGLSDDVWRYLHDGRAQIAGVNPYRHAPADPATSPFRGPEHRRINNPDLHTIYPPATQIAFLAAALSGPSLWSWKAVLLAFELLLIAALMALLRARGMPAGRAARYAWHPLAVLEVAGSAHMEPVALLGLLAGLLLLRRGRAAAAGAALGWAAAAKLLPVIVLPYVRRSFLRVAAVAAFTVLLLYLPYAWPEPGLVLGSLGPFVTRWASNGSAFLAFQAVLGPAARPAAAAVLLAVAAVLWRRGDGPERAAFRLFLALLLLAPVVHPWYLLWVLALLPLERIAPLDPGPPSLGTVALTWTLLVPFAYTVLPAFRATGVWSIPAWAWIAEYLPVYAVLTLALVRTGRPRS